MVKTSITNKIIVIFLIMVLIMSLVLIVFFQVMLSRYSVVPDDGDLSGIIYSLIIVCLLLIIASFILGRYLVSKVSRPLEFLIDQIGDVNTVHIDKSRLNVSMNDEIGMLIDSYNSMKTELFDSMAAEDRQRRTLEAIFQTITYSLIIIGSDYRIEIMNNRGGCFYGEAEQSVCLGEKCYEVFAHSTEPCPNCPVFLGEQSVEVKQFIHGEVYNISSTAIENPGGNAWLVISRQITNEFVSNRQMLERDKLAQIGKVAAAITHEVKNPIAVIKSGVYYLEKLDDDDVADYIFKKDFKETTRLIKDSINQAEHIIHNLLDFSRESRLDAFEQSIDLNSILEQILMLYSNDMAKKRVKLVRQIDQSQLYLKMDPEIFKTILLNLIANALDEMDKGGVLTIASCNHNSREYKITVADTGEGIPDENLEKIFAPFFTTKTEKDNAGLGLWIVKSELSKVNGRVFVEKNDLKGTRLVIIVPKKGEKEKYYGA